MMSLMQWHRLTARMTVKAVAWAEAAVAGEATLVAVVSVKIGSVVFLAGTPAGNLADALRPP
ncbi:hypothetical protein X740_25270 [Mesorhizobium sp. LNHC221B00]|nr:hypothetical protein X740_25270 [Mesorhizobium sp. LNHC221B00]